MIVFSRRCDFQFHCLKCIGFFCEGQRRSKNLVLTGRIKKVRLMVGSWNHKSLDGVVEGELCFPSIKPEVFKDSTDMEIHVYLAQR